jgi:hypothetical protein
MSPHKETYDYPAFLKRMVFGDSRAPRETRRRAAWALAIAALVLVGIIVLSRLL